jgi:hypothetical protein
MSRKISELTLLAAPAEGDYLPLVDISEAGTKRATLDKLLTTYHPTTVVWDDLRVPLVGRSTGGASSNPGLLQMKANGAGSVGVYAYHFDPSSVEYLFFAVQVPHCWKLESELHPHIHWCPINTNAGAVIWGLEYALAEIDGSFGDTTISTVTQASDGVAYGHQLAEWDAIDMTGIDTVSPIIMCRVYRAANLAGDDYGSDAIGLEVDFHYQIDSRGSAAETTK